MKMITKLVAICVLFTLSGLAHSSLVYTNLTDFEDTLDVSITDDYENPGYSFIQNNIVMSAVFGETDYESTQFANNNIVASGSAGNHYYCAGCNGSFLLSFATTSIGTASGVFGVGFNFFSADATFFVTYGDGTTENFVVGATSSVRSSDIADTFWGITSNLLISSIHVGLADGAITQNQFGLDNLVIGSAGTTSDVPEPAALLLFLTGLGLLVRRKA